MTIYIKRSVKEDGMPKKEGEYFVWIHDITHSKTFTHIVRAAKNYTRNIVFHGQDEWKTVTHYLDPVELPSEEEWEIEFDAIHCWFSLSYAQYLTIPRSVLQSMPDEWQRRFVKCLNELDETIDWRPKSGRYWVKLKDGAGRYVKDPLMDYERGRRKIPHITQLNP